MKQSPVDKATDPEANSPPALLPDAPPPASRQPSAGGVEETRTAAAVRTSTDNSPNVPSASRDTAKAPQIQHQDVHLQQLSKNKIPSRLRCLTLFFMIPLMALATAGFGCVSLICGLWDSSGRQQHLVARCWAASLLRIALSPVRIVGAEKLKQYPVAVYASNHLSYMDTPALFAKLPFQFRILAKQGLWKIPFVGWYLKRSGQVPIDSRSSRSAVAGLLHGVAALRAGMPLVLFPEGSRSPDGHLQAAHSGCAFMALRAGVPLIPLALIGTYELLPIHVYCLRPRPLMIIVGDPIPTAGMTTRDADALTARLYEEIGKMYYQYSDLIPESVAATPMI